MRDRARSISPAVWTLLALATWLASPTLRAAPPPSAAPPPHGWLHWRGPEQNGVSRETGLPDKWEVGGANHLWAYDLPGRGTPVACGDRVYALGYRGQKADLQEVLVCLDARTGKKVWDHGFSDFLSDNAYDRYSIGSPTIDPATGNVFVQTSAGILAAFSPDGEMLWSRSLMEEFGRLTFPNGRTGAPLIDGGLVITRGITGNWGAQGPGADRFYAFDTTTGRLVWASMPGAVPPKDNSFSAPVLAWLGPKRVFYVGTGDGSVACVNARTGEPLWRHKVSAGGVNSSVVLASGKLIAGHADENVDSSESGRIVALDVAAAAKQLDAAAATRPATQPAASRELDRSIEAWRLDRPVLTSSPVAADGRVFVVTKVGDLLCINPDTGAVAWTHRLGQDQLHASPLFADGKLYVPVWHEGLYIIRPHADRAEVLSKTPLEGEALGAPAAWNGRIFVHTTARLYCFGTPKEQTPPQEVAPPDSSMMAPKPPLGPVAQVQVVPAEVLLRPGQKVSFSLRGLDANGHFVRELKNPTWRKFVPPGALVRAEMDAAFDDAGELAAGPDAKLSAGQFEVTAEGVKGYTRGRVMPDLPYAIDFEGFDLKESHASEPGVKFAYPPLPWIGARFKFEVRELDGNKVLAKTLDNIFFQRALAFIGPPGMAGYTVEADVRSEGNRRQMASVGVINQRYIVALVGASGEIEVSSNYDRIKVSAPFVSKPNTWYRLKTRVDVSADGSGVVRGKVWAKGEPEPEAWTIEVPHAHAHAEGAPGLYGFSPNVQHRVFIDNVAVRPNENAGSGG